MIYYDGINIQNVGIFSPDTGIYILYKEYYFWIGYTGEGY